MLVDDFTDRFRTLYPDLIGQRVVIAYSGGADSTALLLLLSSAALQLDLNAVHVHHHHRGVEADRDLEHCQQQCAQLSLPLTVVHLTPEPHPPEGREGSWRRLRYGALEEIRARIGADAIATGHHADDVAEGVLAGLLRGGGPRSLAGIERRWRDATVIRPLLDWTHDELTRWLESVSVSWCEDRTNTQTDHLRSRIRHEVLPFLERVAPSVRGHLRTLAHAIAEDERALAELAAQAGQLDPWHPAGGVRVDAVRTLPHAARHRWLPAQTEANEIGPVTRAQLGELDRLLDSGEPRGVTLGGRWRIVRAGGRLWLEPPTPPGPWEQSLCVGQEQALPLPGWRVRMRHREDTVARRDVFDRLTTNLRSVVIRSPLASDRIGPTDGHRRLRDVLRRRLPRHLRGAWPVVCDGDTLLWIPGVVTERHRSHVSGRNVVEVLYR